MVKVKPYEPPLMTSEWGRRTLEVALAELGNGETEGNNRGPDVVRYMGRDRGGSWCAGFVSYCMTQAYALPWLRLGLSEAAWDKRRRGARWLWKAAHRAGERVSQPLPGDLVLWKRGHGWQGHIGIYECALDGQGFRTVEGNVGPVGSKVRRYVHEMGEPRLLGFARLP